MSDKLTTMIWSKKVRPTVIDQLEHSVVIGQPKYKSSQSYTLLNCGLFIVSHTL